MARWSNATLVKLGGFDKNVIIDELLYGEDNYYDITFLSDTQRTVQAISGATITFQGGDNSVFVANDYVSFGDSSVLYQINSVASNSFTLKTTPPTNTVIAGNPIQTPINLTGATFQFRLLQHSATITDDTRAGVEIGNITPIDGATQINLDNNVVTTVTGQSITLGQLRILVNAEDFTYVDGTPVIDTTTPPFFTGFLSVNLPAPDGSTPIQTKKQRICFVIRADGTNS